MRLAGQHNGTKIQTISNHLTFALYVNNYEMKYNTLACVNILEINVTSECIVRALIQKDKVVVFSNCIIQLGFILSLASHLYKGYNIKDQSSDIYGSAICVKNDKSTSIVLSGISSNNLRA